MIAFVNILAELVPVPKTFGTCEKLQFTVPENYRSAGKVKILCVWDLVEPAEVPLEEIADVPPVLFHTWSGFDEDRHQVKPDRLG